MSAANVETLLKEAESLLAEWTTQTNTPEPNRLDIWLEAADVVPAMAALVEARWGYLISITGLDFPKEDKMEAIYHLGSGAAVLGLRAALDRSAPTVASVCHLIPSATLLEREVVEMFGVTFTDTPDTSHLYLPDNWPDDVYPLRKDTKLD
ncbi:MAG: NADH-quinone oxidoreductase subunit C [Phototrophicaceae bacterium]